MADRFENVINLTRLTDFYNKLVSKFFSKVVTTEAVKYSNNSKTTTTFDSLFNPKVSDNLVGTTGNIVKALSANMGKKLNEEKLSSADFKIIKWNQSNSTTYKGNTLTAVYVPIEYTSDDGSIWEPIAIAGYSTAWPNAFPLDIHMEVDSAANYRKRVAMNIKLQQSANQKVDTISLQILYVRQSVAPTSGAFSAPIVQVSKNFS